MIRSFRTAVQFLTAIPWKGQPASADFSSALSYFPAVGALLALILIFMCELLRSFALTPLTLSVVVVVVLMVLTRGLHLDGLADTCDALGSRQSPERMMEILRDPRVGTFGVLGIVGVLALKIAFLSQLSPERWAVSLVAMMVTSRWVLVPAVSFYKYARTEGKAEVFMRSKDSRGIVLSTAIAAACLSAAGGWVVLMNLVYAGIVLFGMGQFISRRLGGMTGDTLGAVTEIVEVVILAVAVFSPPG